MAGITAAWQQEYIHMATIINGCRAAKIATWQQLMAAGQQE